MKLRPYQRRLIDVALQHIADFPQSSPLIVAPTACHARGTRVVTYAGPTVAVENIAVGDILLGPDGKPRNVLRVFHGTEQLYKITPKRGVPFVVNGGHILSLQYTPGATKTRKDFNGVKNIKLTDFFLLKKSERHCLKLRRSSAVEFSPRKAPSFDPWLLGALIGDGSFCHGGVSFTSPDADILSAVELAVIKHGAVIGTRTVKRVNIDCHHWGITSPLGKKDKQGSNTVMAFLRKCGLAGATAAEKFIPDDFKYGSVETRFNILAGLIDTDGHLNRNANYDWITKSRRLAEDFVFVARSLGIRASVNIERKNCQNNFSAIYYRVCLSGNLSEIPVRCLRKKCTPRRMNKNPLLDSFDIEAVGSDEFFGFTLDADHLYMTDDFVIHHNSGKSVIVAELCVELGKTASGMVLVLTHRRELVEQNAAKLPEHIDVGVYSAGLGKKQLRRVTVAGFQSIRKQAAKLPKVSYILIDEAHFALTGYREFIDAVKERSPDVRVIGLTATPYDGSANRTALHLLPADKRIFTGVGAEVTMGELLRDKYLCPLIPYNPDIKLDTSGVEVDRRTGDFAAGQLQAAVDTDEINTPVAREISAIFAERNAVMVFCAGVDHANHIRDALVAVGENAEVVLGDTPTADREARLTAFKTGKLKYIVACEVLLVGFDAPICDGIANLRPSKSALIWVQLCGRGMRLYGGKVNCLMADFTDTSVEMGPLDEIEGNPPRLKTGEAPTKFCDQCFCIMLAGLKFCPVCGFEFQFAERVDGRQFDATTGLLISGVVKNEDGTKTYPVDRVNYEIRTTAKGDPALVAHYMSPGRASAVATDWYNLWHHSAGVVQRDSERWLRRQRNPGGSVPLSAQEALARAEMGALRTPKSVTIKPGSPFPVKFGA